MALEGAGPRRGSVLFSFSLRFTFPIPCSIIERLEVLLGRAGDRDFVEPALLPVPEFTAFIRRADIALETSSHKDEGRNGRKI